MEGKLKRLAKHTMDLEVRKPSEKSIGNIIALALLAAYRADNQVSQQEQKKHLRYFKKTLKQIKKRTTAAHERISLCRYDAVLLDENAASA